MILTAEEARKQALSHAELNEILQDIFKRIDSESRQGRFTCKYDPKDSILTVEEQSYLNNLGYRISVGILTNENKIDNNYYISW